jgi:hypothetical protein
MKNHAKYAGRMQICRSLFLVLLITVLTTVSLYAQTPEDGEDSETSAESEIKSYTGLSLTVSSLPEAKLTFSQSFTLPFLRGEHFLVSGNNIQFNLNAELSPISLNGIAEAVLTPVAFFQAAFGGMIGTGWNIELFGGKIRGVGINRPTGVTGERTVDGSALDGIFGKGYLGGALQFDMEAVFPGDWHHIVFRSYHEVNYKAYSRAAAGEAWFFENDDGENQNGFNYYGNYLLGYQMPIFLDTVALLAEVKQYLYDTLNGDQWGDSLGRWELSLVMNFAVTEQFSATLVTQFLTLRNYTAATGSYDYYRDRILEDNPLRVEFYRVAAIISFTLKDD